MYRSSRSRDTFDTLVWDLVRQIPPGRVTTYGRIAALIPPPQDTTFDAYKAHGARWVGAAMARCPDDVPWQRVINAQGKISLRDSGAHQQQRELLAAEGIEFDENDRIHLDRFGWHGPERLFDDHA